MRNATFEGLNPNRKPIGKLNDHFNQVEFIGGLTLQRYNLM